MLGHNVAVKYESNLYAQGYIIAVLPSYSPMNYEIEANNSNNN